MADEAEKAGQ